MQQSEIPIAVGEEYDVQIQAIGSKGDGVTKINGFVVFVPQTKVGSTVSIRIEKVLANFAFARVI